MAYVSLAIPKENSTRGLTDGRIEEIIRGVIALRLGVAAGSIAALGRWLAAMCVDALNVGYACQQTFSGMTLGFHQQPWNRIRIERVHLSRHFARDFATIL